MTTAVRCFDARKIGDAGIGRYIRQLLPELVRLDKDRRYVVLLPSKNDLAFMDTGDAQRVTTIRADTRNYTFGELAYLPYLLLRLRPQLFHEPHYTVPLFAGCPTVVTIQDLIHLRFSEYRTSPLKSAYAQLMMRRAVRSDRVIVSSENTRRDLVELVGAKADRITVIPFAADSSFDPHVSLATSQTVASRHGLSDDYVLYVGALKPHKNLAGLLRAWQLVNWDGRLAIAGAGSMRERAIYVSMVEALGLRERVSFLGFVEDQDLPGLYRAATALVHPSMYEGFGLTVLEAMASGTPVVASNASSIPEVTGDAAVLVEVGSVTDLAAGIQKIVDNRDLRRDLSEKGILRASLFSWTRTAQATLEIYNQLS